MNYLKEQVSAALTTKNYSKITWKRKIFQVTGKEKDSDILLLKHLEKNILNDFKLF